MRLCADAHFPLFPPPRHHRLPGQIPRAEKARRSAAAIEAAAALARNYRQAMAGSVVPVLFEQPEGEHFTGHAPNYVKVYVSGAELHN